MALVRLLLFFAGAAALNLSIRSVQAATAIAAKPSGGPFMDGRLPDKAPAIPSNFEVQVAFTNLTFQNPMGLTDVPGSTRLAVWEREGRIWTFENDPAATEKTLMLDLSAQCQGWGAAGLLSIAFHPGYTTNGWLFVYYTWVQPGTVLGSRDTEPPEISPGNYRDRLSRFTVGTEIPSLDSEIVLMDQITDNLFHNGGSLFFHPKDGFLYWCNGDDQYGPNQVINQDLLSGVFRIDVDQRGGDVSHPIPRQPNRGTTANYYIPNDNPFVGVTNALEEFYALGLRNPYRMSIDPKSLRIFIGDVGTFSREELSVIEPTDPPGLNFQWQKVEGAGGALIPPYFGVSKGPLIDYSRSDGVCIIGGHVYRGTEFEQELGGRYIFGDNGSRAIWALDESTLPPQKIHLATLPEGAGPAPNPQYRSLSSFGLDNRGELFICKLSTTGGRIYKLAKSTAAPPSQTFPKLLSETGVFQDTRSLSPSTNLLPYDVNSPLWSDGADKKRWFTIPKNATIGFSRSGEWRFPAGSVFVKHFEFPSSAGGDAPAPHRLETRLLVRSVEGGVFGATYKWRPDNSDAELLDSQLDERISVQTPNGLREQVWHYPSPSECLQCHTPATQGVLGLNTRQLNRDYHFPSEIADNQIKAYNEIGLFYPSLSETNLDALPKLAHVTNSTASLELRARSYLDSNCSHCHRPGAGRTYWDARFETPLELSGILNGPISQAFGIPGARTIVPGHPEKSIILHRAGSVEPSVKMPPIAKNVVDEQAVAVLSQYIASLPETTNSLPSGWKHVDIGPASTPASVSFSSDALNIIAGDGEIWDGQDTFSYVYQQMVGDGEITARLAAISGYAWARTGPMIRASLAPGSVHTHFCVASRQGINLFFRNLPDGSTTGFRSTGTTAPVWVRLTRTGNTFIGSYSSNGSDWIVLGSTEIEMPSQVYIGFASSGIVGLGNFIIDNISTLNVPNFNASPTVGLDAQVQDGVAVAGPLLLRASPEDSDGYPIMVEFFDGNTRLGQATSAPFELLVEAAPGLNRYSARAYDNYGAVALSSTGDIEARPIEINPMPNSTPGEALQFFHFGNPAVAYLAEGSRDFSEWSPVATNTAVDGKVVFGVPKSDDFRFFRVRPK